MRDGDSTTVGAGAHHSTFNPQDNRQRNQNNMKNNNQYE